MANIKSKNILTENMRRFGTMNLTEQDLDQNNNGYPDETESMNHNIYKLTIEDITEIVNAFSDFKITVEMVKEEMEYFQKHH